ncbi:MAG: aspartyl protease family protein [Paludibacter sp.]|nr:aspartyl protease family protein [Paludibacter sp.]
MKNSKKIKSVKFSSSKVTFWWLMVVFIFFVSNISATKKPKRILSMPFEMAGSYVIVKVKINDSSPLSLILDSGIRNTLITDLESGDKITINYSNVKELMGLGGGSQLQAYTSDYNTIRIKNLKLDYKTVYVLQNDVFNLSKHTGMKINGLIGVDFFRDYVVEINYTTNRINFYDPSTFVMPKGYESLPISIESQKMFVELSVLESDSTRKQARMLIDTGAELNAWFQTFTKNSVHKPPKWVQGTIGEGLNGLITGRYGHIPQICFGNFCLKNPIVAFPDSATISGIIANSHRDGTIGSELLSRFNLFVDYMNRKIYFKPNSKFKRPYSYNVAGIEIIQLTSLFSLTEVFDVWKNSPADFAGVKEGDQIIEINGNNAFQMTINEIRKIFETPSKHPLNLTLRRDNKEIKVQIDMKDRI